MVNFIFFSSISNKKSFLSKTQTRKKLKINLTVIKSPKIFETFVTCVNELPKSWSGTSNETCFRSKSGVSSVVVKSGVLVTGALNPPISLAPVLLPWKKRQKKLFNKFLKHVLEIFIVYIKSERLGRNRGRKISQVDWLSLRQFL